MKRSGDYAVILTDIDDSTGDNIVEIKHHKLARSLRSGVSTRELKPTSGDRDALYTIITYPPTTILSTEEKDLIWKFRFYLSTKKKALTKFIKCVNWKVPGEERQAIEMLAVWSPPDPEDALELLGPAFRHPIVRRYAIRRLDDAGDDDLMLYILQLVQALKYENLSEVEGPSRHSACFSESSIHPRGADDTVLDPRSDQDVLHTGESRQCLASFLVRRACENSTLANNLFWYLSIECEEQTDSVSSAKQDGHVREMYVTVMKMFTDALSNGDILWQERRAFIDRQKIFIDELISLIKMVARESGNRRKKTDKLRTLLSDSDTSPRINFSNFGAIPFPLDPTILIKGIIPEKTRPLEQPPPHLCRDLILVWWDARVSRHSSGPQCHNSHN
ncbi:hypothetical protein QAD02_012754 [Eretmocerus hayati]|uniref:Uncharacterized protein n=1 Tax=Eretmocerus hayati TaxID=131215 RepID=A0ACC2P0T0_9HYME|nr:hypothetical protein QAD02_012754 [Eretmocerus hayati]